MFAESLVPSTPDPGGTYSHLSPGFRRALADDPACWVSLNPPVGWISLHPAHIGSVRWRPMWRNRISGPSLGGVPCNRGQADARKPSVETTYRRTALRGMHISDRSEELVPPAPTRPYRHICVTCERRAAHIAGYALAAGTYSTGWYEVVKRRFVIPDDDGRVRVRHDASSGKSPSGSFSQEALSQHLEVGEGCVARGRPCKAGTARRITAPASSSTR